MTKRSLQQQKVVSYALLRGKLVPRDEVLKQRLGLNVPENEPKGDNQQADDSNQDNQQAVNFEEKSAKELKALLDEKGIEYKGNASKEELIDLLNTAEHSEFEIKEEE